MTGVCSYKKIINNRVVFLMQIVTVTIPKMNIFLIFLLYSYLLKNTSYLFYPFRVTFKVVKQVPVTTFFY